MVRERGTDLTNSIYNLVWYCMIHYATTDSQHSLLDIAFQKETYGLHTYCMFPNLY